MRGLLLELVQKNDIIKTKDEELVKMQEQIRQNKMKSSTVELENRLSSLTDMLMLKQNGLEAITNERNALRLQLESLEVIFAAEY